MPSEEQRARNEMLDAGPPPPLHPHTPYDDDAAEDGSTERPRAELEVVGAWQERALPSGDAPLQLYSLATPPAQAVGIMLEEMRGAGGSAYDAHAVDTAAQHDSGFVALCPTSRVPALVHRAAGGDQARLFESAACCLYLAGSLALRRW